MTAAQQAEVERLKLNLQWAREGRAALLDVLVTARRDLSDCESRIVSLERAIAELEER